MQWLKRWLFGSTTLATGNIPTTPAEPAKREAMRIADGYAPGAGPPVTDADYQRAVKLATPTPGVVPTDKLAMDSFMPTQAQFIGAQPYLTDPDIGFLGFPYLAALAQRAEYRMIVDAYAREMTRKWIEFKSTGADKSKKIKAIEAAFIRLGIRDLMAWMIQTDGYFGRAQIYPDLGDKGANNDTPLLREPETVEKGSLKGFVRLEPIWTYPRAFNTSDPFAPDFYCARGWYVVGKSVDESRMFTMVSHPVPDIYKPLYAFGGLSRTQLAKPYVDNWLRTRQSVSDAVHNYSVWAWKTNMSGILGGGAADQLKKRVTLFNQYRDNNGVAVIDKDDEELVNVSQSLTTLDDLQAQSQEQMASVAGVPLVVLLQITPKGLNTSTEGEMQAWYDRVHAEQEFLLRPILQPVFELVQLSELGAIDPDITFRFVPLQESDPLEEATIRKTNADTAVALIAAGVLDPDDERERLVEDESSLYAGMALSTPEPVEETDDGGGDGESDTAGD